MIMGWKLSWWLFKFMMRGWLVDSMRFSTCSLILVLKAKYIMMMVEEYASKTLLIIDLSTDMFAILMMFHTLMWCYTKKTSWIGSWTLMIIFLTQRSLKISRCFLYLETCEWCKGLVKRYTILLECEEVRSEFPYGQEWKDWWLVFFFPCDYDEILFYTSYSHRQANFFQKDSSENLNIYSFRENENLDFIYEMKISIQEAGLED